MKYTNADKIREMSNEELAEFIKSINQVYEISYGEFTKIGFNHIINIDKWLESEVE